MSKKSFGIEPEKKKKKKKVSEVRDLSTLNWGEQYRPHKIEDYLGQDLTVKTVLGWVKSGKFPATFMIAGNTGSGKTTMAFILGQYLNCATLDACGTCPSCVAAASGHHPDILDFDMGGDSGKVKGASGIISSANLSPRFRRRVFILDECHLMSNEAESKFLKITEKPPEKTVWIFVTTDIEKMKSTLRNRANILHVRPIESSIIAKRLMEIAKIEGMLGKDKDGAKEACMQLAEYSSGQMRMGISLLQQTYGAVMSGSIFNKELINDIASNNPEIDLESKAVQFVAAYLAMDLIGVVQFIREAGNSRGLLAKTRWLLHGIIGDLADTNKWQSAGLKMFLKMAKAQNIETNPVALIYLQRRLADVEAAFNSTSVPEEIQLESSICALMCDLYRKEINIDLGNDQSDSDKKAKKKKKSKK